MTEDVGEDGEREDEEHEDLTGKTGSPRFMAPEASQSQSQSWRCRPVSRVLASISPRTANTSPHRTP